jgi:protein gp37
MRLMADHSKIEWTDATWTPIRARCWEIQDDGSGKERIGWHCEHISEGCRNCYAESINRRLGTGFDFKPGNLRGKLGYYGGGKDRPEVFLDEKMLLAPLKWKKPRMIFVCSMTDLFADFVKNEWIDRVFAVMALCPQHRFQVLTKRAKRMREYMTVPDPLTVASPTVRWISAAIEIDFVRLRGNGKGVFPLPNVWLGISAEDQARADERIPELLQTPAAVRFVSLEPLLGAIAVGPWLHDSDCDLQEHGAAGTCTCTEPREDRIDWVIVGGESGKGARPMHPDWVRSIRDQCASAGVPFFMKQWGEWQPLDQIQEKILHGAHGVISRNGRFRFDTDIADPPEHMFTIRLGKSAAGRLLDGKLHDGMPG